MTAIVATSPQARAVSLWLEGRTDATRETYKRDWEALQAHVGVTAGELMQRLSQRHQAAELLLGWRGWMLAHGYAPASINRRLTSIRSLLRLVAAIDPDADVDTTLVKGVRSAPYRDVRGPGLDNVSKLLDHLRGDNSRVGRRTLAAALLMFQGGLRRIEVLRLRMPDLDFEGGKVWVWGKGYNAKEKVGISITEEAAAALRAWLAVRPAADSDVVFCGWHGEPLCGPTLNWALKEAAKRAGIAVRVRPHGLRHAAATALAHNYGLNDVATFGRWRNASTASHYLDAAEDKRGEYAAFLAAKTRKEEQA